MTPRRYGLLAAAAVLAVLAWFLFRPEGDGVADIVDYTSAPVETFPAIEDGAIRQADLRDAPARFDVTVVETIAHDSGAFTQGLEFHDGVLYESTGLVGASSIRATDPTTGVVDEARLLPGDVFGEGLTIVGDEILVLTWQSEFAFRFDIESFAIRGTIDYSGEGWGLCRRDDQVVMSNGSPELTFRDPVTFAVNARVEVRFRDAPVERLNELECAQGAVWANIWKTPLIVRIDPDSGTVTGVADLRSLIPNGLEGSSSDVLNGIAYDAATDTFLVTGKRWPVTYRVELAEP